MGVKLTLLLVISLCVVYIYISSSSITKLMLDVCCSYLQTKTTELKYRNKDDNKNLLSFLVSIEDIKNHYVLKSNIWTPSITLF